MSPKRDPLFSLAKMEIPAPDETRKHQVLSAARDSFQSEGNASRARRTGKQSFAWQRFLAQSRNWLLPAGAGLAAVVATVALLPGLYPSTVANSPPPPLSEMAQPEPAAPRPAARPPVASTDTPIQNEARPAPSTQMGAARQPMAVQPESLSRQDARGQERVRQTPVVPSTEERLQFADLELLVRRYPTVTEILVQDGQDQILIEARAHDRATTLAIVDAVRIETGSQDWVALQVADDAAQQADRVWDAYLRLEGRYRRSPEMSKQIRDASTPEEVRERLQGSAMPGLPN